MSPFLDDLETQLHDAARAHTDSSRGASRWPGRRWIHSSVGAAGVALGVIVALAIAGFTVVLVGQHHNVPSRPAPTPVRPRFVAPYDLTLKQLLDHFAVLRRPQTAADRSWRGGDQRGGPFSVKLTGLTRLAQTLSSGERAFLTVDQIRRTIPGTANPPVGSVLMTVELVDKQGNSSGALYSRQVGDFTIFPSRLGSRPPRPRRAGRGQIPPRLFLRRGGPAVWTSAVPDGVSRVRWTFACVSGRFSRCNGFRGPLAVDLPVHENVVAARIAATDNCTFFGCRPTIVTWYDAAGRQIATYNQRTALGPGPQPAPFPGANP